MYQFGSSDLIVVEKQLSISIKSIVKFNLSGMDITPSSTAVLRLYVLHVGDTVHNVTVSRLDEEDWEEATVSGSSLNGWNLSCPIC